MFRHQCLIGWTAAALAMAAGSLPAQIQDNSRQDRDRQQDRNRDLGRLNDPVSASTRLQLWSDLRNIDLYNETNTKIGDLEDAVIERGSGRIDFLVVDTTRAANRDGKTVLLPYRTLRPMSDDDRFRIDVTAADLASAPEFNKRHWRSIRDPLYRDRDARDNRDPRDNRDARDDQRMNETNRAVAEALAKQAALEQVDPYHTRWPRDAKTMRVEGEIIAMDRRALDNNGGEYTILTIRPKNGDVQAVVLGPTWHVMGNEIAPIRGSQFSGEVVRIGEGDRVELVVVTSTIDGRQMRYRDPQGAASWGSKDASATANRFLLASELKGKNVELRDNKAGEIEDLIIEVGSGRIAFAALDPNINFLGIGDKKRLVPWSIVYARPDGKVIIDATKEMLAQAMVMPKNLKDLSGEDLMRGAYAPFSVTPQTFTPIDRNEFNHDRNSALGVWGRDGTIGRAIRDTKPTQVEGKVVSMQRGREPLSNSDAVLLSINVDGTNRVIVLAPAIAADSQNIKPGDELVIEVWDVPNPSGAGRTLVAKRITQDGRHVASWGGFPE